MTTLRDIEKTMVIIEYLMSRNIDSTDSRYEEFMLLILHGESVEEAGSVVFGDMI